MSVNARLDELTKLSLDELVEARFRRYRSYGPFTIADQPPAPAEKPGIADRLRGMLGAKRNGQNGRGEE